MDRWVSIFSEGIIMHLTNVMYEMCTNFCSFKNVYYVMQCNVAPSPSCFLNVLCIDTHVLS
jgi:hypothetical protein